MSEQFKCYRTDIGDEAHEHVVEAHNAYEAARKFAEEEWAREEYEDMEFEIVDSFGKWFDAVANVEMQPSFDIGCRTRRPKKEAAP